MTTRIDLGALQRQLDAFEAKFGAWAQRAVAGAEALRDGHLARLREFQGASRPWRPAAAAAARFSSPPLTRLASPAPAQPRYVGWTSSMPTWKGERQRSKSVSWAGWGGRGTFRAELCPHVCRRRLAPCRSYPPEPTHHAPARGLPAGLASESSESAALQAELGRIQEEQARLPALVQEVADALEAEAAAFARQEAGACWHQEQQAAGGVWQVLLAYALRTSPRSRRGSALLAKTDRQPTAAFWDVRRACRARRASLPPIFVATHCRERVFKRRAFLTLQPCSPVQPGGAQRAQAGGAAPGAGMVSRRRRRVLVEAKLEPGQGAAAAVQHRERTSKQTGVLTACSCARAATQVPAAPGPGFRARRGRRGAAARGAHAGGPSPAGAPLLLCGARRARQHIRGCAGVGATGGGPPR